MLLLGVVVLGIVGADVHGLTERGDRLGADGLQVERVARGVLHGRLGEDVLERLVAADVGDERADLASTFELPDQRAATCVEEYDLASASWEAVLEPLKVGGSGRSITFQGDSGTDIGALLESEVADLNEIFTLPEHVIVAYDSCGEENAFYDPASLTITICSEYVDFLERQAIASDL